MSKNLFKRLMARKTTEFRKMTSMKGLSFKTSSEIEREKAVREKEQERISRQRGEFTGNGGNRRSNRNSKQKRNA